MKYTVPKYEFKKGGKAKVARSLFNKVKKPKTAKSVKSIKDKIDFTGVESLTFDEANAWVKANPDLRLGRGIDPNISRPDYKQGGKIKYQTSGKIVTVGGKQMSTDSEEYRNLYNNREIASYSSNPNIAFEYVMPEMEIKDSDVYGRTYDKSLTKSENKKRDKAKKEIQSWKQADINQPGGLERAGHVAAIPLKVAKTIASNVIGKPAMLAGEIATTPFSLLTETKDYLQGKPYNFNNAFPNFARINDAFENPDPTYELLPMHTGATDYGNQKMLADFLGIDKQKNPVLGFAADMFTPTLFTAASATRIPGMVSRTGKFLTTNTPIKHTHLLNPWAGKLSKYNRVVGSDAIEDLMETGVLRTRKPKDFKTGLGINLDRRGTTPYPSFSTKPSQTYIDQVIKHGDSPLILSTDAPMGTSTFGRHGKGSTLFPIDESGKFLSELPASQVSIFDSKPHWLGGYKKITNPYSKKFDFENINWEKDYFSKVQNNQSKLQKLLASNKITYKEYKKQSELYENELQKQLGLTKRIGRGAYGEVFEIANDPSRVIKLGNSYGGTWTPELIESLKSIKQNSNIAIPEIVKYYKIPSLSKGYKPSTKEVMIMPNLNKVKSQYLDLNKRDRYAYFLKQARQLRDKGIELDVYNMDNFKFNENKGIFDIYDINPGSFNKSHYMTYIHDRMKERLLDNAFYKNGGFIKNLFKLNEQYKHGGRIKRQLNGDIPNTKQVVSDYENEILNRTWNKYGKQPIKIVNFIPSNSEFFQLSDDQKKLLEKGNNLDKIKNWYADYHAEMNPNPKQKSLGFKHRLDEFNTKETLENYNKEEDNFNKSFENNKEWYKNWYDKRRQLPQFKDVATQRYNIKDSEFSPHLRDQINMNLRSWELEGSRFPIWYSDAQNEEPRWIPFPKKHNIRKDSHAFHDGNNKTWYDVNSLSNFKFIDSKGKPQNSLITHEESHLRDALYPQPGTKMRMENRDDWRGFDIWDPLEYIISKEDIENSFDDFRKGKEGSFNSYYHYKPTEVRARLNAWRQINNIDPLKNYSPDEIKSIIDENLKDKNLDDNIKELYQIFKNNPEHIKFIHDSYVSNQKNNSIKIGKEGGRLRYQLSGEASDPTPNTKEFTSNFESEILDKNLNKYSRQPIKPIHVYKPGVIPPGSEFSQLTDDQKELLKRGNNLSKIKSWYEQYHTEMNPNKGFLGFKDALNEMDHFFDIKKILENQDKEKDNFNEAFQNNQEWYKNWYDKRRQLSNFKDVAEKRYNMVDTQFVPHLSDKVNMGLRDWQLGSYEKEYGDLPFPKNHYIPRSAAAFYDRRGHTWYDVNAVPSRNFTDKDGKSQNSLITHEESHLRDHYHPQKGTTYVIDDLIKDWRKPGGEWDPIELLISREDVENTLNDYKKGKKGSFDPRYHYQPTEVRARLNVWRQRNNIDPLMNYSPEEIQNIMDEDLKNKNLDHNIKELYRLLKNNPKYLKFINDSYVSNDDNIPVDIINNQNNNPIKTVKYGGTLKYQRSGLVNNPPMTYTWYAGPNPPPTKTVQASDRYGHSQTQPSIIPISAEEIENRKKAELVRIARNAEEKQRIKERELVPGIQQKNVPIDNTYTGVNPLMTTTGNVTERTLDEELKRNQLVKSYSKNPLQILNDAIGSAGTGLLYATGEAFTAPASAAIEGFHYLSGKPYNFQNALPNATRIALNASGQREDLNNYRYSDGSQMGQQKTMTELLGIDRKENPTGALIADVFTPTLPFSTVGKVFTSANKIKYAPKINITKNLNTTNPAGNMWIKMPKLIKQEMLPELNNADANEVLNNFLTRIRTPEGQKRLKELGIDKTNILDRLKIVADDENLGYYWGSKIGLHPRLPEMRRVTRHEIEHAIQDEMQAAAYNKWANNSNNLRYLFNWKKAKIDEANAKKVTTSIDESLKGLELRKTPEKVDWNAIKSSRQKEDPSRLFEYLSDKERATNYFDSGSDGREKSAFLAEVQQYMMDNNIIPKDSYVEITPEMVKNIFIDAMFDEKGGGKYLRIFNIMKPTAANFELLAKNLNKMLGLVPAAAATGAAGYGVNQIMQQPKEEFRTGGRLKYQYSGNASDKNKVRIDNMVYDINHPKYADLYEEKIATNEVYWDEPTKQWLTTAKTAYSTAPKWNPKLSKAKNDEIYEKWQKKQDPNYVANQVRKGTGNFATGVAQGAGAFGLGIGEIMNTPLAAIGEVISGRGDFNSVLPNMERALSNVGVGEYTGNQQMTPGNALFPNNPLAATILDIPADILLTRGANTLFKQGSKQVPKLLSSTSKAIGKVPKVNLVDINKFKNQEGIDYVKNVTSDPRYAQKAKELDVKYSDVPTQERPVSNNLTLTDQQQTTGFNPFASQLTNRQIVARRTRRNNPYEPSQMFGPIQNRHLFEDAAGPFTRMANYTQTPEYYNKIFTDVDFVDKYLKQINKSIDDLTPEEIRTAKDLLTQNGIFYPGVEDIQVRTKTALPHELKHKEHYTKKWKSQLPEKYKEAVSQNFDETDVTDDYTKYRLSPEEQEAWLSRDLKKSMVDKGYLETPFDEIDEATLDKFIETDYEIFTPELVQRLNKPNFLKWVNKTLPVVTGVTTASAIGSQLIPQEGIAPEQKALGGKLKYQDGGKVIIDGKEVDTSSQEYKDLYNAGILMGVDSEGLPNMYAPEVEVTAEAPLWLKQKRQQEQSEYTDDELERYMYQGKKPDREKDFLLPPGERLKIYNAVMPFEYPNKEFPKALKRYITGKKRKFLGQKSIKEEDRDLGKTDEDAWAHFMGLPQLYNTVNKSEYIPTNSKEKGKDYYTIRKGYPDFDELLLENAHNWFQRKNNANANTLKGVGSPFMPLENVTYSKGQDEKGKYYSMYDIYDFNVPYQKGIGKPYEVYDRVYYDDTNPDKPVVLKNTNKQKYGGTLKYQSGGLFNNNYNLSYNNPYIENKEAGMHGMMKSRMAIDAELGRNSAAKRMTSISPKEYTFTGNEMFYDEKQNIPAGATGTHYTTGEGNVMFPIIQEGQDGNLFFNRYASPTDKEAMRFETPEEASYFGENYKNVAPMMYNERPTQEDRKKVYQDINNIMSGKKENTGITMTKLNPDEEFTYQQWVKGLTPNLKYSAEDKNYDMRGAWKAGLEPELFYYDEQGNFQTAHPIDVNQQGNLYEPHLGSRNPYTGKMLKGPNHETFMHAVEGDIKAGYYPYMDFKTGDIYTKKYAQGGKFGGVNRWFAEKWVDVKTGKPCGRQEGESRRSYPACRPSVRINSKTPKTSSELSSAEKEKFKRSKTSSQRINYQHKRNK